MLAGGAGRQAQARRPAAGARQPASARRADAHRHAVAGARPHRAGGDGADRGQSARAAHAAHPERCAGLLLRRHPVDPDAGLREGDRRHPGRRRARQGAVAARPHRQDRRQAGERGRRAVGRALGGRRRPRRHLFGDAARGLAHRGRRNGGRPTIAGRSSSPSTRRWPSAFGLGARRHHHGERAGPRHRGQDRLAAAHRMDDARPSISSSSIRPACSTRRRTPSSPR